MTALDTDTLSLLFANHPVVSERRRQCPEVVAVPLITRLETLRGRFASVFTAESGSKLMRAQNTLAVTEAALARYPVLPFDDASAAIFDRLRAERKLRAIGRADLLIACICLAHKATLVTRNLRHFRAIPGLTVENWAD